MQGRSQQPHLPREVPRSLREDDRVGADRAVAVKNTVNQAELKFLRALEDELRESLVPRPFPAQCDQQLRENRRVAVDRNAVVVGPVGPVDDGRRLARELFRHHCAAVD